MGDNKRGAGGMRPELALVWEGHPIIFRQEIDWGKVCFELTKKERKGKRAKPRTKHTVKVKGNVVPFPGRKA